MVMSRRRTLWPTAVSETVRLGAWLARDLPGLWRQILRLQVATDPDWQDFTRATTLLRRPLA
jgi:hypothetical protein